jgi:hypothetical protein
MNVEDDERVVAIEPVGESDDDPILAQAETGSPSEEPSDTFIDEVTSTETAEEEAAHSEDGGEGQ